MLLVICIQPCKIMTSHSRLTFVTRVSAITFFFLRFTLISPIIQYMFVSALVSIKVLLKPPWTPSFLNIYRYKWVEYLKSYSIFITILITYNFNEMICKFCSWARQDCNLSFSLKKIVTVYHSFHFLSYVTVRYTKFVPVTPVKDLYGMYIKALIYANIWQVQQKIVSMFSYDHLF